MNSQGLTSTLAHPWTIKGDQQLDTFHTDKYHTSVWFLFLGFHTNEVFHFSPHISSSEGFYNICLISGDNLLFTVIKHPHWGNTICLKFWVSVKTYMVYFMFLNHWIFNCLDKIWVILSLFNQIRMGTLKANSKFSSDYTQVFPALCLFILWKKSKIVTTQKNVYPVSLPLQWLWVIGRKQFGQGWSVHLSYRTRNSVHTKCRNTDFPARVYSQCELVLSSVVCLLYIPHSDDIKCEFVQFLCFDSISSLVCHIGSV